RGGTRTPGLGSARGAVFGATYAGASLRVATFRPHIGCVPASGGGGGPVPYRATALAPSAFPPGQPTTRRIRTLRLRANATQTAVRACAGAERLVHGRPAVAFYTAAAPDANLVLGVATSRTVRNGRVVVAARSSGAIRGVRAIVQVGAVCAGGS